MLLGLRLNFIFSVQVYCTRAFDSSIAAVNLTLSMIGCAYRVVLFSKTVIQALLQEVEACNAASQAALFPPTMKMPSTTEITCQMGH